LTLKPVDLDEIKALQNATDVSFASAAIVERDE